MPNGRRRRRRLRRQSTPSSPPSPGMLWRSLETSPCLSSLTNIRSKTQTEEMSLCSCGGRESPPWEHYKLEWILNMSQELLVTARLLPIFGHMLTSIENAVDNFKCPNPTYLHLCPMPFPQSVTLVYFFCTQTSKRSCIKAAAGAKGDRALRLDLAGFGFGLQGLIPLLPWHLVKAFDIVYKINITAINVKWANT